MTEVSTLVDIATREVISELVGFLTFGTYVEVGVYLGGNIIRVAKENLDRDQIKIFAVDNFKYENISDEGKRLDNLSQDVNSYLDIYYNNLEANGVKNKISNLIGDSLEASKHFATCEVDIIFLDGDHNWPYVKYELDAWIIKIKVGGIIMGHDYCSAPSIQQASRQMFGNNLFFVPDKSSYITCKGNTGVMYEKLKELQSQGKLIC